MSESRTRLPRAPDTVNAQLGQCHMPLWPPGLSWPFVRHQEFVLLSVPGGQPPPCSPSPHRLPPPAFSGPGRTPQVGPNHGRRRRASIGTVGRRCRSRRSRGDLRRGRAPGRAGGAGAPALDGSRRGRVRAPRRAPVPGPGLPIRRRRARGRPGLRRPRREGSDRRRRRPPRHPGQGQFLLLPAAAARGTNPTQNPTFLFFNFGKSVGFYNYFLISRQIVVFSVGWCYRSNPPTLVIVLPV